MTEHWRGHEIVKKDGVYYYVDTGKPVAENPRDWCGHCGLHNTPEGHDGCIGHIPTAMNACCGHGKPNEAYVQYK